MNSSVIAQSPLPRPTYAMTQPGRTTCIRHSCIDSVVLIWIKQTQGHVVMLRLSSLLLQVGRPEGGNPVIKKASELHVFRDGESVPKNEHVATGK